MKLSKANVPFTMVANEVLVRPDLSFKAKGLFAYLFSKPEGWDFSAERISQESRESKAAVQNGLIELERAKLLTRHRMQSGRMEYHLSYGPEPEQTHPLFTAPRPEKAIVSPIDGLNELIEAFEPVNPAFRKLFANKSQRAAVQRLVQTIGFDKTRGAIRAAVASFGKKYAPMITTPCQLEDKLGALAAFVTREGGPSVVTI